MMDSLKTLGICQNKDCTVSETGVCLEGHLNLDDCPHFEKESPEASPDQNKHSNIEPPPLEHDVYTAARQFHAGLELGIQDAAEIMRKHYAHIIGILGATNSGKTCFLSSLYLLTSHGSLSPNYFFAGSLTLPGFEARARRLRKWEGNILPEKLIEHTTLKDNRNPSFMHLAFNKDSHHGKRIDLLLTDLPGEWSTSLIERVNTSARFDFLKRADSIIIVIDGVQLDNKASRNIEVQNAKLLLQRLSYNIQIQNDIPLVLLVSKGDLINMKQPERIGQIEQTAKELGFKPITIVSSAFSSKPNEIKSGSGVIDTINAVLNWDASSDDKKYRKIDYINTRSFLNFRIY